MSRWVEIPKTNRQGGLKIEVPDKPWADDFSNLLTESLLSDVLTDAHLSLKKAGVVV